METNLLVFILVLSLSIVFSAEASRLSRTCSFFTNVFFSFFKALISPGMTGKHQQLYHWNLHFYKDWNTNFNSLSQISVFGTNLDISVVLISEETWTQRKSIHPSNLMTKNHLMYWCQGSNLSCTGKRPEPARKHERTVVQFHLKTASDMHKLAPYIYLTFIHSWCHPS